MLEIADRLIAALDAGGEVTVATLSAVLGSAPRTVGTSMALAGGRVIGSISGGCVEGAAVDACERVLETGAPETARFGFTDDDAFAVGLSCGGELDVVVTRIGSASVRAELEAARAGRVAGLATVVGGPAALIGRTIAGASGRGLGGDLTAADLSAASDAGEPGIEPSLAHLTATVRAAVEAGFTGRRTVECGPATLELLVESRATAPLLVLVGAVEFAAALAVAARPLGYRILVCDARPVFATPERFPAADEVVVEWPNLYLTGLELGPRDAVCVLSHDDRFDVPVIREALQSDAGFVGALGSRRTHDRRMAALVEAGLDPEALDRLRSPIGLDLGASTPEETAVAILAEILAVRRGGSGRPLRELDGPIHRDDSVTTAMTVETTSSQTGEGAA